MNKDNLLKYSQSYCKIRIPIGIFFTVFLGVILLLISYKSSSIVNENEIQSTKGKVVSGQIMKYRMMYFPEVTVKYTIDKSEYTYTAVLYQHNFLNKETAQKFLETTLLQKDIPIYYSPQNPQVVIFFVEEIRFLMKFLRYFSILLFLFAGIMFLLKDNPIFCGLTIFSDTLSVFRLF